MRALCSFRPQLGRARRHTKRCGIFPDGQRWIEHAIAALECTARDVAGEPNATLGEGQAIAAALKKGPMSFQALAREINNPPSSAGVRQHSTPPG